MKISDTYILYIVMPTDSFSKKLKVIKHRLVSHTFDPKKEDQREDYFYSLLYLFLSYGDEASLF